MRRTLKSGLPNCKGNTKHNLRGPHGMRRAVSIRLSEKTSSDGPRASVFLPGDIVTHAQSWLCEPSQKGLFLLCLQPHQATVFFSSISVRIGVIPLPRCDPSQKGCPCDFPQAHQAYLPGAISCTWGLSWVFSGSAIVDSLPFP